MFRRLPSEPLWAAVHAIASGILSIRHGTAAVRNESVGRGKPKRCCGDRGRLFGAHGPRSSHSTTPRLAKEAAVATSALAAHSAAGRSAGRSRVDAQHRHGGEQHRGLLQPRVEVRQQRHHGEHRQRMADQLAERDLRHWAPMPRTRTPTRVPPITTGPPAWPTRRAVPGRAARVSGSVTPPMPQPAPSTMAGTMGVVTVRRRAVRRAAGGPPGIGRAAAFGEHQDQREHQQGLDEHRQRHRYAGLGTQRLHTTAGR